ncbi:MAG: gas vesicle protein GvpG [Chloroflexi bacterium]|nr:gas vesicle protein GvpG [Chloroflexota bacterium]
MLIKLLTAPLAAPLGGFKFVLNQLKEVADKELSNPERLKEALLVLQLQLEEGQISEGEFRAREAEIIQQLRVIRQRELGG